MNENLELTVENKLMSAKDVAAMLGVSKHSIWSYARKRMLPPHVKLSARCTRWLRDDVVEFANTGKVEGNNVVR